MKKNKEPHLPKNQKVWVTYKTEKNIYKITSLENDQSKYFLWKLEENEYVKMGQSQNPLKLEERIEKDGNVE